MVTVEAALRFIDSCRRENRFDRAGALLELLAEEYKAGLREGAAIGTDAIQEMKVHD